MKKNTPPLLNITVPVFNRPELTRRTIRAVREHTHIPFVLTVVDNGSDRETRDMLTEMKAAGEISYLFRLEKNYGVAVAANVGWRLVDAPLYMKLDNDVVVHSSQWFPVVFKMMKSTQNASVWGADLNRQLDNKRFVAQRHGLYGRCHSHVSGGAVIIPKTVADVAGALMESHQACLEHVEFSKPFIASLNSFISIQNAQWAEATAHAGRCYKRIRYALRRNGV